MQVTSRLFRNFDTFELVKRGSYMTTDARAESGNLVVDMVCDVCRVEGFEVEKNAQTDDSPSHFVDILASRKKGKKIQKVAFECWEGPSQVEGREVEKFAARLKSLGIQSGIYVSPKGFGGNAEFMARKLGVELWDLAKLRERVENIKAPERHKVPGTLPVARAAASRLLAHGLANGTFLKLSSMPKLEFRPYFFANFQIDNQRKRLAQGVLVFDGVDGRVCDAALFEGHMDELPSTGFFVDCLEIESSTGSMPKLPPELEMKNTVTVAPAGVTEDVIRSKTKDAVSSHGDATVTVVQLLHVPIVTVEMLAAGKSYRKILQAATGRMIWDDTQKCSLCDQKSRAICEVCGGTVCTEHERTCSSCRKHLCTDCIVTKGIVNKIPLCPTCKNA
ncbi:MAG TPA: restriction endonuclease [Candidatus Bathyarchaeia archaeon]